MTNLKKVNDNYRVITFIYPKRTKMIVTLDGVEVKTFTKKGTKNAFDFALELAFKNNTGLGETNTKNNNTLVMNAKAVKNFYNEMR